MHHERAGLGWIRDMRLAGRSISGWAGAVACGASIANKTRRRHRAEPDSTVMISMQILDIQTGCPLLTPAAFGRGLAAALLRAGEQA